MELFWHLTVYKQKRLYLYETELFEIQLFICIKMDLALITFNGWRAIKRNQTKLKINEIIRFDISIKYSLFLYNANDGFSKSKEKMT